MSRPYRSLLGAACALFAVAQMVPVDSGAPAPDALKLEAALSVPPPVAQTLNRACKNCHSYETEWPWYAKLAPASWVVAYDVQKARKVMNFSEWHKRPYPAIGALTASCSGVQSNRMPPERYLLLHPEARLSAQEKESLCQWTRDAIVQIRQVHAASRKLSLTP